MKVYNLPEDLYPEQRLPTGSVIIRPYLNDTNTLKNKIVLQQNMINLLIRGSKTIVYAEDTTTISDNEFLILSSGNCLTSELVCSENVFSSILIYFDNQVLKNFLVKHQVQDKGMYVKMPFLKYKQDAFVRNYIQSLMLMTQVEQEFSAEFKLHKLEELLLYLLHQNPSTLNSLLIVSAHQDDMNIRKAVESNVGKNMTLEELAFLCNVSLSTFKRRFQKIYLTSPQRWFLEQKMKLACELLKHPDERPGLVFQKIGYENHSSFSETFKNHFGLSPKEYQEKL